MVDEDLAGSSCRAAELDAHAAPSRLLHVVDVTGLSMKRLAESWMLKSASRPEHAVNGAGLSVKRQPSCRR